ncbi:MAG: MOSC domain-containing protein, partial [Leptolyngbyaceae bacterium]|nr:MOSC domain-containing protein [Leptolyngbyaceae bacterium]
FSTFLDTPCRLVRISETYDRPVDRTYSPQAAQVSFADGFPLLMISEASLADLNQRLVDPLPMNRFRPNLVVSGCEPFAEDTWQTLRIGEVTFYGVKPCTRCVVTTTDQRTAIRGQEPLVTLAQYRRIPGGIIFGQNLVHAGVGEVQVGNGVEVLAPLQP